MSCNVHFDFCIPTNPEEINLGVTKRKLEKKATNLCNNAEKVQNISANCPATACNINDISWFFKEKCKMIEFLKDESKETDNDVPQTDVELYINLYESLFKENDEQTQLLEYKIKELQEEKKILAELRESLHLMKTNLNILEASDNNDPGTLDLTLLKKNSSKKFQEVRKYLHSVLESHFTDNSFTELIKELTEAYFKGGDERYIEISEQLDYAHIEILKNASLVVEDPYNARRVKFDDIV